MVRSLEGPTHETKLHVVFYACSDCSWFFVAEESEVNRDGDDLLERVTRSFGDHLCAEYPHP